MDRLLPRLPVAMATVTRRTLATSRLLVEVLAVSENFYLSELVLCALVDDSMPPLCYLRAKIPLLCL